MNGGGGESDRQRLVSRPGEVVGEALNLKKKRSNFLADVDMPVELPDLPNDGKLLRFPVDTERLYAFCASSLELRSKPEYYPERDLGIPIEAIDPNAYALDEPCPELHPDDELILSLAKECIKADRLSLARRREQAQPDVPVARWFRKPEIMSNSLFTSSSVKQDHEMVEEVSVHQRPAGVDPDSLLQHIEESFVQHRDPPRHSTNPNLEAVSVLPVFPHEDLSKLNFSHVMFDRPTVDPKRKDAHNPARTGIFMKSTQTRSKDFYTLNQSTENVYDWTARYVETLPNTTPANKDKLFFLLTPSAVLYSNLSSRESMQKVPNIDSLPEDERAMIPAKIILADSNKPS